MKKRFFCTSMVFLFFCFFVPSINANTAPDFEYSIQKNGVPDVLLPFMTVFEGRWNGGPDYKLIVIAFNGKKATIAYSWSKWENEKPGFEIREVKFNPKKKKLFYRSEGFSYYYRLKEKNGVSFITGVILLPGNRRDNIILRPVVERKQ